MTHAITLLQAALDTARHNEPIIRSEGRIEEADKVRAEVHSLEAAVWNLGLLFEGSFEDQVARIINYHSLESGSNTPDFILADYLKRCLENFNETVRAREKWTSDSDDMEWLTEKPVTPKKVSWIKDENGEPFLLEEMPTRANDTAPTIDATIEVNATGWEFTNTEEFRVKQESPGSDIWLVGRRGKKVFRVSRRDLGDYGLGRPYHYDRIPYKLIIRAIKIEEEKARKAIEREEWEARAAAYQAEVDTRRADASVEKPKNFWQKVRAFFRSTL